LAAHDFRVLIHLVSKVTISVPLVACPFHCPTPTPVCSSHGLFPVRKLMVPSLIELKANAHPPVGKFPSSIQPLCQVLNLRCSCFFFCSSPLRVLRSPPMVRLLLKDINSSTRTDDIPVCSSSFQSTVGMTPPVTLPLIRQGPAFLLGRCHLPFPAQISFVPISSMLTLRALHLRRRFPLPSLYRSPQQVFPPYLPVLIPG